MSTKGRPIVCLDFDGVIHDYKKGWNGGDYPGHIYGKSTPGFWTWAAKAQEHFHLVVYSSRSKDLKMKQAMMEWMMLEADKHGVYADILLWFEFAHEKPAAFLTIDDRAICFTGNWDRLDLQPDNMKHFRPWMEHIHNPAP